MVRVARTGVFARCPVLPACVLALALLVTACGSDGDDSEPTAAQDTASSPTAASEAATATPEPTQTPTAYAPPPTVAAPLYIPPATAPPAPTAEPTEPPAEEPTATAEPAEVPTATPEPEVVDPPQDPDIDADTQEEGPVITDLLLESDLTDWPEIDVASGQTYVFEDAYHVYVTATDGNGISMIREQADYGNVLAVTDVQMVSESSAAVGCLTTRGDAVSLEYYYALCISGNGVVYAYFDYVDADGNYGSDLLVDYVIPESLISATVWNTLLIYSYESEFGFFINDELLGIVEHTGPSSGVVGISVYNFDLDPAEFRFTNFEIWAVE